jgi:hypothetical protein
MARPATVAVADHDDRLGRCRKAAGYRRLGPANQAPHVTELETPRLDPGKVRVRMSLPAERTCRGRHDRQDPRELPR